MYKLLAVQGILMFVVLICYPGVIWFLRGKRDPDPSIERAMFMPSGTVRAMIALVVVGSFVNVLVFGSGLEHFDQIIAAFGAISGSIIGFYFGTRSAQRKEDFKS